MDTYFDSLTEDTSHSLLLLRKIPLISQFYLAGGTALALQLRHRISADLDFFISKNFDTISLIQRLSEIGNFQLEKSEEQTVIGFLNNTKVSFFGYRYPLLFPLKDIDSINMADIIDIACMKIDAISSRGAKRDFIDIYFIAKEISPLSEILKYFEKKYSSINYNMMHIKKSLVYFEDAEDEPLPKMLKHISWEEIKKFFQIEIAKMMYNI